jgi:FAD synthase
MKKTVIAAIGVFDGVHLGHRALLKAAVRRAHASIG